MSEAVARAHELVVAFGATRVVEPSSFEIPVGGVTAVIGPNGSGKSTLLGAMVGLVEPAGGTLEVLGTSPHRARRRISYVLQSTEVAPGNPITVLDTVRMARYPGLGLLGRLSRHDHERVAQAMELLDITHLARRHLTELSGGQRQRVFVAQGIAQDHDALLLDEPLVGLDLVSARTIDGIIHSARDRGASVVITTHDLDEARAADHVVLMSGRVVASGPPAEVCTRRNLEVAYGLGALHPSGDFLDDHAHGPHEH
ncbi:metal ABC transporter ATP-binding protein [Rhabdothermincola salaria]|uniref:metal ABC transporter ATP-binding protein n=1 Tax=Rhabdothermincola salaria TaxID=2903142 RepID=UPI001E2C5B27|nr:metal ABC transporter ATP-binding protein [Rhabdothermincola salaria]MCD9622887.1 metal ABC transporter ATP-binding protein [Rhabdothermincola salaria]